MATLLQPCSEVVARVNNSKEMSEEFKKNLRIKVEGQYYWFCLYSLSLGNLILQNRDYYKDDWSFNDSDIRAFKELMFKFNVSMPLKKATASSSPSGVDSHSFIILSPTNNFSLLSIVNGISLILLSQSGERLKSEFSSRYPDIGKEGWVLNYFKSAEYFFDQFKEDLKDDEGFKKLMQRII